MILRYFMFSPAFANYYQPEANYWCIQKMTSINTIKQSLAGFQAILTREVEA